MKTGQVCYKLTRLCEWISNVGTNHLVHVSLHTRQTLPGYFGVVSSWVIRHLWDTPTHQSLKTSNFWVWGLDSDMDGCWGGFLTWSNGQIRDFVGELWGICSNLDVRFVRFNDLDKTEKRECQVHSAVCRKGFVSGFAELLRFDGDGMICSEQQKMKKEQFVRSTSWNSSFYILQNQWICMDLLWFVLIGYSGHDRLHPVGFGATSGACRSASCTFHYSSAQPVPTRMQTYAAHTLFDMNRTIQRRLAPDICTIFQEVIFLTVAYCIIMFDFIKNILIIHYRFIHEHFIKRWAERCK